MNGYGRVSFICTWSSRNGRGGQTSLKMAPVLPITRQGQIARAGQQENRTRDPHDLCVSAVSDCWIYDRHGVCKTFNSLHQHSKAIIVFVRVRHSWQLVCVYVYVHCVQMSLIVLLKYVAELLVLHMQRIRGGFGENTSAHVAGQEDYSTSALVWSIMCQ